MTVVQDQLLTIRWTAAVRPALGESLEIYVEVPDVGPARVAGVKVVSVQSAQVMAVVEMNTGAVKPGHRVRRTGPTPAAQPAPAAELAPKSSPPAPIGPPTAAPDGKKQIRGVVSGGFERFVTVRTDDPQLPMPGHPVKVWFDDPRQGFLVTLGEGTVKEIRNNEVILSMAPGVGQVEKGLIARIQAERWIRNRKAAAASPVQPPPESPVAKNEAAAPPQGWLGATIEPTYKPDAVRAGLDRTYGVVVLGVAPGGPADRAGIQAGDVLLSVDGQEVRASRQVVATMKGQPLGSSVPVELMRGGQKQRVNVVAEPRPDDATAIEQLRPLAEQGEAWAAVSLAILLTQSKTRNDPAEALRRMRQAADGQYARAYVHLVRYYAAGVGCAKDPAEAFRWAEKAAAAGLTEGQFQLGVCYQKGTGVARDLQQAVAWLQKAAENDHSGAQVNLGRLYMEGQGVEKDYAQALAWSRKAAEAGEAMGMHNLGVIHVEGYGVTQDRSEGLRCFRRAAEQGLPLACYSAGMCYANGWGVAKDLPEAAKWFRKGAEAGDAQSQCALGQMHQDGLGINQDFSAAVAWYRKAAAQGEGKSQYQLGLLYETGSGVAADRAEALRWYRKAALQGEQNAIERLKTLPEN